MTHVVRLRYCSACHSCCIYILTYLKYTFSSLSMTLLIYFWMFKINGHPLLTLNGSTDTSGRKMFRSYCNLSYSKVAWHLPPPLPLPPDLPSIIDMFCSIIDKIISGNNFISTSDSKSRIMFGIVIKAYWNLLKSYLKI